MNEKYYDLYTGYLTMISSNMEIHLYKNGDLTAEKNQWHDFFELFCLVDGEVDFQIGNKKIRLTKNQILLIPPSTEHSAEIHSANYERIVLWMNPWYLNRLSSRKTNLTQCFATAKQHGYVFEPGPYIWNRILTELYNLIYETHENEFGKDILIDSSIQHLLIMLNRYERANVREDQTNIYEVIRYINQHYTENITLDSLCLQFYISKFYLSRSFEAATGKSVYQYILEKRMIMARQLLVYGEKPTDIYTLCGFNNYSNFYRAFKKYYQVSPRDFIKSRH